MANTPFYNGFLQYSGTGSSPTFEQVQMAIAGGQSGSTLDTRPIFYGDPVVQACSNTGVPTGYVTQAYGPVGLTVGAAAITVAAGVVTVTFSNPAPVGNGVLPTSWAPPVGSQVVVSGCTPVTINGVYTVTSSTTTTAVCAANLNIAGPSSAIGTVTVYVPIAGIFLGCEYLSTLAQKSVWSRWWPGQNDAASNALAWVVNDPNAQWEVQSGLSTGTMQNPVAFSAVGQNIGFAFAAGSGPSGTTNGVTPSGISTAYVDSNTLQGASPPNAPQLLPFRVLGLKNFQANGNNPLAGINGNDSGSAYNRLVVGFNNSMNRQLFGI